MNISRSVHVVQKGDTLNSLAEKFATKDEAHLRAFHKLYCPLEDLLETEVAAGKWSKTYDKVKILDKKCVTEISELKCSTGGKITILKHGQQ
ncbi:PAAR-like protein, partial [Flavobacterium covae]